MIFVSALLINSFCDFALTDIIYETVSAVSTVGVTTGITPQVSNVAKVILLCLMYFGRVGILTITYAIMNNQSSASESISYPDANMLIG